MVGKKCQYLTLDTETQDYELLYVYEDENGKEHYIV
jgi:hypothetical protein